MTKDKVLWEEATETDTDTISINGNYYKYTDINTETSTNPDDITDNYIRHHVNGSENDYSYTATGGAIFITSDTNNITGNFIDNHAEAGRVSSIWDYNLWDFYSWGGALYNGGTINNITGSFFNNRAIAYDEGSWGGAIFNWGVINNISGDFIGNSADTGGAIFNADNGIINNITGNFINNIVYNEGGAIANGGSDGTDHGAFGGGTITLTNSNFYNNSAFQGGAIFNGSNWDSNAGGIINIKADNGESIFSGNKEEYYDYDTGETIKKSNAIHSYGGEINLEATNNGIIHFDDGIVLNNTSFNINGDDSGSITFNGLIEATDSTIIQSSSNVFFGSGSPIKGYAYNLIAGTLNNAIVDDGGTLTATDAAKIINLLAKSGSTIDLASNTNLSGDIRFDVDATLQGNFDYNKIFDEIVEETGSLTLEGGINAALSQDSLVNTSENKSLVLSSGNFEVGSGVQEVSGWKELNVTDNATVKLAGDIALAETQNKMNLLSGSTLDLAGNSPLIATIDGSVNNDGNMTFTHATDGADDVITIKGNYKAYKNAMMTIDVDVANNTADILTIEGDVIGRTRVVINPINDNGGTATMTDKALFVEAPNDDTSTGAYFDVYRMVADARVWNSYYENNKWYVGTSNVIANSQSGYGNTDDDEELVLGGNNSGNNDNTVNITQPKPQVVSEAIAYMSLPRIGLEQTKDLMRVVSNKVTSSKIMSGRCGMGECNYDGQAVNGAWIDLGHKKSEIDAPVAVEAKINAVDLGFDIQKDLHNRLGIFASYRQGEYELSGDGEDYYAKEGADIDIDSWILGLYHRYDYGRLWTMSSIYGGIQKVDMSTDDGVSSDTDGIQFGGSVEAGLVFEPQKRLTIEPSIRLGYNFIKYDDMSDSYGKTAEFDNVQNIEAEAGVKVEKTFFHNNRRVISKIYVKPSIIKNFGKGDVNITSLDTVEGLENETLIRGEIGGSFNFGNGWSGFGSLGYTYGSDYNATDFNLGVNYNW